MIKLMNPKEWKDFHSRASRLRQIIDHKMKYNPPGKIFINLSENYLSVLDCLPVREELESIGFKTKIETRDNLEDPRATGDTRYLVIWFE